MNEKMDALGFKHKVGDFISYRGASTKTEDDNWASLRSPSNRYMVLERIAQECPGGVQLFYRCRGFTASGAVTTADIRLHDIEVEASEGFTRAKEEKLIK